MLVAILAMVVLRDSHATPDSASLVNQLGSARYAQRVSAEGELFRLGRMALPALRAAKVSGDAEIRTRAVALVSRIENSLLLQPTPIGLDFGDVPLTVAIETINRQTGLALALSPEDKALLEGRRITLRSNEPLPFWKAIDAFCLAGNLHASPSNPAPQGILDGCFPLHDGLMASPGPISDSGPFRVQLTSVHYQSEIQMALPGQAGPGGAIPSDPKLAGHRPVAQPNREFFLQFVVAAEPTLSITRNGAVKLSAAVDDRGQSLVNPSVPSSFQHASGYFGMSPSPLLRFRVDLNYPASQAKQIRTLRGAIPVIVATRKPDPLVFRLGESKGQVLRSDQVALTLLDHRPASTNQPATIQVAIKTLGTPAEPVDQGNGEPLGYRPDSLQQQIEILDAEARALPWFPSSTFYNGEETRLTLSLTNRGTTGPAVTLRYHEILRASTDVAFEFRDIPIP